MHLAGDSKLYTFFFRFFLQLHPVEDDLNHRTQLAVYFDIFSWDEEPSTISLRFCQLVFSLWQVGESPDKDIVF